MITKLPIVITNRSEAIALHLGGERIITYWSVKGQDHFQFEDTEKRVELSKVYNDMAKALIAEEGNGVPVDVPKVSDADAVRIACMVLKLRADIAKARTNPANQMIFSMGDVTRETDEATGATTVSVAGTMIHSKNASEKMKQKLLSNEH